MGGDSYARGVRAQASSPFARLCLIGFINRDPGIMRPFLVGIFLKAVGHISRPPSLGRLQADTVSDRCVLFNGTGDRHRLTGPPTPCVMCVYICVQCEYARIPSQYFFPHFPFTRVRVARPIQAM